MTIADYFGLLLLASPVLIIGTLAVLKARYGDKPLREED